MMHGTTNIKLKGKRPLGNSNTRFFRKDLKSRYLGWILIARSGP